jgi:hypothetical protein
VNVDVREVKFYVVAERQPAASNDSIGLSFEDAFERALALVKTRYPVQVLYTDGASQMQLTRFLSHGIQTSPKKA